MRPQIRSMLAADWPSVRDIYEEGIATGNATFESAAPSWEAWDAAHLPHSRFVAISADKVAGWAVLSGVSSRCVYAGVAEVSIYISQAARGQGIGRSLLLALIEASERENIWTLQAGIFPENTASLRLFQHCGFRILGQRERPGQLAGRWRDVVLLERRSRLVGT